MLGNVLDSVQDLVDLVDRGLAKAFSDPWPPPSRIPIVTGRERARLVRGHHAYPRATSHTVSASRAPHVGVKPCATRTGRTAENPKAVQDKRRPVVRGKVEPSRRLSPPRKQISLPSSSQSKATCKEATSRVPRGVRKANTKDGIRADDIRPDLERCDILIVSIAEMEICKEIFAGWRSQLDLAEPHRKDKLEHAIIESVNKLDVYATSALRSSRILIRNYQALVRDVDRRLGIISQTREGGSLFDSSHFRTLSADISAHSDSLGRHVKRMQEMLRDLVKDIEKTKEKADKRALRRKIWGWLSKAFKALAALLSAGGAIFALLHPLGLLETTVIAGASMLSGAVARLCDIAQDKYSDTTFDEILVFLRDHVPESAKAAEFALTSFQACHRILRLELEVREGKRSGWVSQREARQARDGWIRVEQKLRVTHPRH
ncbi:hypothetical protein M0805_004174 [Coniferiporia weirii]|nr:hypothetical protein M0805_004174 [Coniferiporia weirii]